MCEHVCRTEGFETFCCKCGVVLDSSPLIVEVSKDPLHKPHEPLYSKYIFDKLLIPIELKRRSINFLDTYFSTHKQKRGAKLKAIVAATIAKLSNSANDVIVCRTLGVTKTEFRLACKELNYKPVVTTESLLQKALTYFEQKEKLAKHQRHIISSTAQSYLSQSIRAKNPTKVAAAIYNACKDHSIKTVTNHDLNEFFNVSNITIVKVARLQMDSSLESTTE